MINFNADFISQRERREVLENDRQVHADRKATTYRQHAEASVDDDFGGRYARLTPTQVTGVGPVVRYPRLPADNPSNQLALTPKEEPLGYSIEDQEPVGEPHELRASTPASQVGAGVGGGSTDGTSARPAKFLRRF